MRLLIGYFIVINIIGVWVMYVDKKRSVKRKYRIPEKRLWLIAFIGGAVGCTFGMFRFRHKTKHISFKIGFPVLALLDCALLAVLLIKFSSSGNILFFS